MGNANAGAHAPAAMQRRQGRQKAQRIAANVAIDNKLELVGGHKHAPVWAAWAQERRARWQPLRLRRADRHRSFLRQQPGLDRTLAHDGRVEFAAEGKDALALYRDAHQPDLVLDKRVQFFDDDQPVHAGRKIADHLLGQRPGHPQLEKAGIRKHLPGILVCHAAGHDAQRGVAHLDPVQRERLGKRLDLPDALLDHRVPAPSVARHHHVFAAVNAIRGRLNRLLGRALAQFDEGVGMADAGRNPHHHRPVKLLAQRQRHPDQVFGLLAVAGLQARDAGKLGIVTVVLLILRAVHVGIIGGNDDQPRLHARHRDIKERIGRHVEADVLHHRHRPAAGISSADGDVQGHLFIRRPL